MNFDQYLPLQPYSTNFSSLIKKFLYFSKTSFFFFSFFSSCDSSVKGVQNGKITYILILQKAFLKLLLHKNEEIRISLTVKNILLGNEKLFTTIFFQRKFFSKQLFCQ